MPGMPVTSMPGLPGGMGQPGSMGAPGQDGSSQQHQQQPQPGMYYMDPNMQQQG